MTPSPQLGRTCNAFAVRVSVTACVFAIGSRRFVHSYTYVRLKASKTPLPSCVHGIRHPKKKKGWDGMGRNGDQPSSRRSHGQFSNLPLDAEPVSRNSTSPLSLKNSNLVEHVTLIVYLVGARNGGEIRTDTMLFVSPARDHCRSYFLSYTIRSCTRPDLRRASVLSLLCVRAAAQSETLKAHSDAAACTTT